MDGATLGTGQTPFSLESRNGPCRYPKREETAIIWSGLPRKRTSRGAKKRATSVWMRGQTQVLPMGREYRDQMLSVPGEEAHQVVQKSFGIGCPGEPAFFGTEFDYPLSLHFRDGKAKVLLAGDKAATGRPYGRAPDADKGIFFCAHSMNILNTLRCHL